LAKGIVAAFPELRDEGDCPWVRKEKNSFCFKTPPKSVKFTIFVPEIMVEKS